jgi:hypothetical protein
MPAIKNDEWKVVLVRAKNGFIVTFCNDDEVELAEVRVYAESEEPEKTAEMYRELLFDVAEHLAMLDGEISPYTLRVEVVKRD